MRTFTEGQGMLLPTTLAVLVSLLSLGLLLWQAKVSPFAEQEATVGMYAAVAPNEYNTIAQDLAAREAALEKREAAIEERESGIGGVFTNRRDELSLLYTTLLGLLLLAMILFNFFLDARRNKRL